MVLAGCPKEICKKCGKVRERISKSKRVNPKTREIVTGGWGKGADPRNQYRGGFGPERPITERKTIGFTKCNCEKPEYEAGIGLDPFCGLGTVGVVCKKLKRNYIGIDLSPNYCKMAEERIRNQPFPLL